MHFDPVGNGAANTGNAITFGASDHSNGGVADAGIYTRSDGTYGSKMYFATTDSYAVGSKTAMMIDNAGNVGIGVTGPDSRLTVSSGTANYVANFKSTDGTAYVAISDNSSSSAVGNQVGVVGDQMYFADGDVERMRLVPDRNSTFVIIKANPASYNSKSFITLYGTNS